jgi:hypothetical protein
MRVTVHPLPPKFNSHKGVNSENGEIAHAKSGMMMMMMMTTSSFTCRANRRHSTVKPAELLPCLFLFFYSIQN